MKIRKAKYGLDKLVLFQSRKNQNVEYIKNNYRYNITTAEDLNLIIVAKEDIKSEKYTIELFEIVD